MKDRILSLLKRERLTSSQFAERIGVQRSSVSHILSGRNKPGFDFIVKILTEFDHISAEWLILGHGEMLKNTAGTYTDSLFPPENGELLLREGHSQAEPVHVPKPETRSAGPERGLGRESGEMTSAREIERIVIFYRDKSFDDFTRPDTN